MVGFWWLLIGLGTVGIGFSSKPQLFWDELKINYGVKFMQYWSLLAIQIETFAAGYCIDIVGGFGWWFASSMWPLILLFWEGFGSSQLMQLKWIIIRLSEMPSQIDERCTWDKAARHYTNAYCPMSGVWVFIGQWGFVCGGERGRMGEGWFEGAWCIMESCLPCMVVGCGRLWECMICGILSTVDLIQLSSFYGRLSLPWYPAINYRSFHHNFR